MRKIIAASLFLLSQHLSANDWFKFTVDSAYYKAFQELNELKLNEEFDDTIFVSNINFINLQILGDDSLDNYCLYYHKGELAKIEFLNEKDIGDFGLYLTRMDNITLGIGFSKDKDNQIKLTEGFYLFGNENISIYFGLKTFLNDSIIGCYSDTQGLNNLISITGINEKFRPVTRINYVKGKHLSFSYIFFKGNKYHELMTFPIFGISLYDTPLKKLCSTLYFGYDPGGETLSIRGPYMEYNNSTYWFDDCFHYDYQ